jgi:hypothetical protein
MASSQLLNELITKNEAYCLNAASEHPLANLWNADERFVLKSDADEQLIIHLPFNEKVNLTGISFCAPTDGETEPTTVKVSALRVIAFRNVMVWCPLLLCRCFTVAGCSTE